MKLKNFFSVKSLPQISPPDLCDREGRGEKKGKRETESRRNFSVYNSPTS